MTKAAAASIPLRRLLLTAAIVMGASAPHWLELAAWIPALLATAIAWRLGAAIAAWPLPNRAVRLVLAVLAFTAVLFEYHTINGVTAGSALLVVMVSLKFLEARTLRDQLVLMIIAYFLVFASLLYERGLLTGAYLLVFVWVTTAGLLQLGRQGPLLPTWPTAKLAGRLLLQSVPVMIVLFLLFPRLPGPLWGTPGDASRGTTGLSEEMSPGDITDLGLSDEVAFRAEFLTEPPRANELYWRGPVLSSFNGRSWTRDPGMRGRVDDTIEFDGEPVEYRVMLEPHGRRWGFALDMPTTWSGRRDLMMGSDYQLRIFFGDGVDRRIDYRVVSYTDYRALEPLTPAEQARFRRLPEDGNPRTRALVQSWLVDDPSPEQIIERALDVFRGEEFFYTLTPLPLGRHTADEFIFETHEGFCEHYASAFTIMMRAAGLPARVVTGYQGGELNGIGEYYIVRQSDAHAWTEVWLEDQGWVRVDPISAVAPERIALGSTSGALARQASGEGRRWAFFRTAMFAWDTLGTYWNDWVIGYGPRLQRSMLRELGIDRPRWSQMIMLAIGATIVVLVVSSIYLAWRWRTTSHAADPAARWFERFAAKLARARVDRRAPGEGPVAYGLRAQTDLPASAPEIEDIVESYLRARYEPDNDRCGLSELAARVRRFKPMRV